MDFELMISSFPKLLNATVITLKLLSLSLFFGLFIGLLFAILRMNKNPIINKFAYGYSYVFRGTPLLVQIFIIYFGLGQIEYLRSTFLWVILKEPYWCGIITLTISTGAYSSEIIRGGILSVSKNFIEASGALGLNKIKTFLLITLPITVRQALPAYGNELILMVKASSLISIITLMEITGIARTIISKTYAPVEIFLVAGSIYLIINFIIVLAVGLAERKLGTVKAN